MRDKRSCVVESGSSKRLWLVEFKGTFLTRPFTFMKKSLSDRGVKTFVPSIFRALCELFSDDMK